VLGFILRRSGQTVVVLLVASFVVYVLTAYSGDPLSELRTRTDPAAQRMMMDLTERLNLDTPPVIRYFGWLAGVAGCLIGRCDLGISIAKNQQPVAEVLQGAIWSTLQLVTLSAVLALLIGVAVGMATALRQHSGFDYTVTFFAFVFYSLPIFWVAVLLKEYGAIRFNQFLQNPSFSLWAIAVVTLGAAFIGQAIAGGDRSRRLKTAAVVGVATLVILIALQLTNWLKTPSIGLVGVVLLALCIAAIVVFFATGFSDRLALMVAGGVVVASGVAWYPFQFLFFFMNNPLSIVLAAVIMGAAGAAIGLVFGGDRRAPLARMAATIGALTTVPFVVDQMLLRFDEYLARIPQKQGVISTIGSSTPSFARVDDMWLRMLDGASHLILPTIALMIISLAGYTRYARSSLLEVLNQDYVRTARAKGLGERTVIIRHAMRNALIPIATVVALDFGAIIGGAVITERVFAWQGMGSLFLEGLGRVDVNLVMGFFVITGLVAVVFNVIADIAYSLLDPRIRVK
jgi:peptide/nickel transport system permease protein